MAAGAGEQQQIEIESGQSAHGRRL
jgi:hypothetical protein